MRFETTILAFVLCVVAGSAVGAQCRADSAGTAMVEKYKGSLRYAERDGEMRLWFQRNGIPRVDPNTVVLVTDRQICSKAMRVYNNTLKGNGVTPFGSVYVVKIGTVYVVKDPAQTGAHWALEAVLGSDFRVMKKLLA